eukprot:m.37341 g.37341  ORF g.37341 m.37341 type:complete len:210 (+) comp9301_c0_seq1:101-730(+)
MDSKLDAALKAARSAVIFDGEGDKKRACAFYVEAATLLQKYGNSPAGALDKQKLEQKAREYVERAEQLADLAPLATSSTSKSEVPRWVRQEAHATKLFKEAQSDHQDHKMKDALKNYQKAAQVYADAGMTADPSTQERIRQQWILCCERIQQLGGKQTSQFLGTPIQQTPETRTVEEPPTKDNIEMPEEGNDKGTDFDSLQKRLAQLKK